MRIPNLLKNIAYILAPESLLKSMRSRHHYRQFQTFDIKSIPEFNVLLKLVPEGSVVIDVGANIGLYSKCFSDIIGSTGHVYSIEPIPETYDVLTSNIKQLQYANVTSMNYAASDVDSIVTMEIPTYQSRHGIDIQGNVYEGKGDNFYEAKIIHSSTSGSEGKRFTVKARMIDSLFSDLTQSVSLIKCDVEGHELECILGSLRIIRRSRPALLIEIMSDVSEKTSPAFKLFETLMREGYMPFYLKDKFLMPVTGNVDEINFFFLMPHHIAKVGSFITA